LSGIEQLNRDCFCLTLDREALRRALDADPALEGMHALLGERCPHVFSARPVFLSRANVERMQAVIRAVESVVAHPRYAAAVLADAPPIARHDPGARGVFMGYDFHVEDAGPRLIEVNTNAGGAMLNAVLARAQRSCCEDMSVLESGPIAPARLEDAFVEMFREEWRAAGRAGAPRRIAIVDEDPAQQYLYPEFLLFARMFQRHGIDAVVRAPAELAYDGVLRDAQGTIDLVYNRLTDFYFEAEASAPLRAAYLAGSSVITPHPRAHALYADKRNLARLTDPDFLRIRGVPEETVLALQRGIPMTVAVDAGSADALWANRRALFFKPAAGYGAKAAYRGDKLTRRVWGEILAGRYVAQNFVPPGDHLSATVGGGSPACYDRGFVGPRGRRLGGRCTATVS
jgi:hypothetical protein